MSEYSKLSLKKELLDTIQKFIEDYPERGYRSLAQFVEDAVRRRADELKVFQLTPRFKHVNLYEDHVTIEDRKFPNREIEVFVKVLGERGFGLWCEFCGSSKCEHVAYALGLSGLIERLGKKGWEYRRE